MRKAPDALMLFAAGFGKRMGALTADRPKPLIKVAGRTLLDHALDLSDEAGVERIAVNLHYKGDQIEKHLACRPSISLTWEREDILETGGGLRAALPVLGHEPLFTLNSDAVWAGPNPLSILRNHWDPTRMDALLLLAPLNRAHGHDRNGDFNLDDDGRISRAAGGPGLVYLGAQIIDPAGLEDIPLQTFSLNLLWDKMIDEGRAFGLVHPGEWCDVGRPEQIKTAEYMLKAANV